MSALPFHLRLFLLSAALCCLLASLPSIAGATLPKEDRAGQLLGAELPSGTVLATASCEQLERAVFRAVRKAPEQAVNIFQRALEHGQTQPAGGLPPTQLSAADSRAHELDCLCLTRIVRAAMKAAPPSNAHEIIEAAVAAHPQCADTLTADLVKPARDFKDGVSADFKDFKDFKDSGGYAPVAGAYASSADNDGFIGFTGNPGLIGSPPSGATTLFPPVGLTPVTPTTNP